MFHSFQIIGSRQLGGCEKFYMRLVLAFNNRGYPALAINRPGSAVSKALDKCIRQAQVPLRNGWDFFSTLSVQKMVRKSRPVIVQTYMGRATRLTRLSSQWRSIHVARLGGYYKIGGYYEHAHAWVANTQGLCDYLVREGLDSKRIYHIGNFVDKPPPTEKKILLNLRRLLKIPDEAIILFSLGRFIEKKGFDDLLTAFSILPGKVDSLPVYLVVAGDGPLFNKLRRQTEMLGLSERLRWVGWQNDPTPYFHLADMFVCPSRNEPLGNVILEAWAHQLPVISTRTYGGFELISDGENGRLVPVDDPKALSECMHDLLQAGSVIWHQMANNGFSKLIKEHNEDLIVPCKC